MQAVPNKTLFGFTFFSQMPLRYSEALLTAHGYPEAVHVLNNSLKYSVMTP